MIFRVGLLFTYIALCAAQCANPTRLWPTKAVSTRGGSSKDENQDGQPLRASSKANSGGGTYRTLLWFDTAAITDGTAVYLVTPIVAVDDRFCDGQETDIENNCALQVYRTPLKLVGSNDDWQQTTANEDNVEDWDLSPDFVVLNSFVPSAGPPTPIALNGLTLDGSIASLSLQLFSNFTRETND